MEIYYNLYSRPTTTATEIITFCSCNSYSEIDYIPVVEAIEFQSGESEKEVNISLINDKHAEALTTFPGHLGYLLSQ